MYDTLVLSGGSTKGLAILGAIHAVLEQQTGKLPAHIVGTSVGAMIGLLLAVGYEPREILGAFAAFDMTLRPNLIDNDMQFLDSDSIIEYLRALVSHKIGSRAITFKEMSARGIELYIVAYNCTRGKKWIFCADRTPDVDCLDAVRASSALPGIFRKCYLDGELFVDGGLASNFPAEIVSEFRLPSPIGIVLCAPIKVGEAAERGGIFGLIDYMMRLMFVPIEEDTRNKIARIEFDKIVIDNANEPFTKFVLTRAEIIDMYLKGYKSALEQK